MMEVYAIIVHAGGTSWSGHYYAYVKVGDSWYKMDDSHVTRVSEDAVFNQNAYLIFYRKVYDEKVQEKKKEKEKESHQNEIKLNGVNHEKKEIEKSTINDSNETP